MSPVTDRYVVRGYASLEHFYDEEPPASRRRSCEVDYGVMWSDPLLPGQVPPGFPRWRVAWVENTGEVYAVCASADGTGRCPVRLYGAVWGRDAAEELLDGWAEACPSTGSLAWLEARFRNLHIQRHHTH